ncbi:MAG: hypothetical protein ABIQ39_03265 [Ilumatobacteraceae bacterium]
MRSGGMLGTGLKVKVPNGAQLQVDDDVESTDGHYVLGRYNGTTGYIGKANVSPAALGLAGGMQDSTSSTDSGRSASDSGRSSMPDRVPTPVSQDVADSAESESEEPDIGEIFDRAGDLASGLATALQKIHPIGIDLLLPHIEAAPKSERDAAWQDKTLMAGAKRVLSLDDYLALLPARRVFKQPTGGVFPGAQGARDGHTSAAEVDVLIGKHLGKYVAEAQKAGRKAEGEISVVGNKDWKIAFERQWPGVDPGMASAFVDVDQPKRHIWLHKDRGDPGTAIHEGMHKYANNEIRNRQRGLYRTGMTPIGMLDEGLTEYFTRLITPLLGITRSSYPNKLKIAKKLVRIVGEGITAKAYFDGDFDSFINAYLRGTGRTKTHWDHLSRAFETEKYGEAGKILNSGAES